MIHYIENSILKRIALGPGSEHSANPKMRCSALGLRNKRISCFVYAIVQKSIGAVHLDNEASQNRFPQCRMNLLFGFALNQCYRCDLGDVTETGKLPQRIACRVR